VLLCGGANLESRRWLAREIGLGGTVAAEGPAMAFLLVRGDVCG
jgi:hypothetical protein